MGDNEALAIAGAAWTATGVFMLLVWRMWNSIPAVMGRWIEWRQVRAAEKAADWTRLRDMLQQERAEATREREESARFRIDQLAENARCHEALEKERAERAILANRVAQLEGFEIGRGEARQEAAVLSGAKRLIEKKDEDK